MKKLKNGWLHPETYKKAILFSGLVLIGFIGFDIYEIFGRKANVLTVILYAVLGILIASLVFTTFYSKDLREFSNEVNEAYMSMDPKPFYDYIESLDFDVLAEETLTKIAFFTAWFKHFEGKNDEAREFFEAKNKDPFPYPQMLSLKALIEIYLLDDYSKGYEIVDKAIADVNASNLKNKEKTQLEQEIRAQYTRLDCITKCEASDEIIESLKQKLVPFEYVQNSLFLAYLVKDKDPKTAYFAKDYVLKNYGNFEMFKMIAEKLVIDYVPTEEDLKEQEELNNPSLPNEENSETPLEEGKETEQEEVKEENKTEE